MVRKPFPQCLTFIFFESMKTDSVYFEALNNTFRNFPTTDICRMKNSTLHELSSCMQIEMTNGTWYVEKIFGVKVSVDNNECRRFALRLEESDNFLSLLTTFDFVEITKSGRTMNMVWSPGISAKAGKYLPACLYYTFEDFIRTYKSFTDERFDEERLVIVCDED